MKYFLPILLLAFTFSSCAKKNAEEQAKKDDDIIKQYIADNNLTAVATGTGLYYVIENQGTGGTCNSFSTVRVSYKGFGHTTPIYPWPEKTEDEKMKNRRVEIKIISK